MSVVTLPVKAITVDDWALVTALYHTFADIETYPHVDTTVTAEVIVSGAGLIMVAPE